MNNRDFELSELWFVLWPGDPLAGTLRPQWIVAPEGDSGVVHLQRLFNQAQVPVLGVVNMGAVSKGLRRLDIGSPVEETHPWFKPEHVVAVVEDKTQPQLVWGHSTPGDLWIDLKGKQPDLKLLWIESAHLLRQALQEAQEKIKKKDFTYTIDVRPGHKTEIEPSWDPVEDFLNWMSIDIDQESSRIEKTQFWIAQLGQENIVHLAKRIQELSPTERLQAYSIQAHAGNEHHLIQFLLSDGQVNPMGSSRRQQILQDLRRKSADRLAALPKDQAIRAVYPASLLPWIAVGSAFKALYLKCWDQQWVGLDPRWIQAVWHQWQKGSVHPSQTQSTLVALDQMLNPRLLFALGGLWRWVHDQPEKEINDLTQPPRARILAHLDEAGKVEFMGLSNEEKQATFVANPPSLLSQIHLQSLTRHWKKGEEYRSFQDIVQPKTQNQRRAKPGALDADRLHSWRRAKETDRMLEEKNATR